MIDRRKRNQGYTTRPTEDDAFSSLDDWSPNEAPSKIIQFNKQLELPLLWWVEGDMWRKPYTVSAVERPTEDEALRNVDKVVGILSGKGRTSLNYDEIRVYKCSLKALQQCPRHYDEIARGTWIANRLGMDTDKVLRCLKSADCIMENLDIAQRKQLLGFPNELPIGKDWEVLAKELLRAA